MVAVYPDGNYDQTSQSSWFNANDRVAWERSFAVGTDSTKKMASAMIAANPQTSDEEIRAVLATPPPPAYSGLVKVSPTLDDVLSTGPSGPPPSHLYDRAPTDFSGTPAGRDGTSYPSLSEY